MAKISEMQAPALPLTGLELVPSLQGGGASSNVGIPLLAYGQLPNGPVLRLRTPMVADLSATSDADPGAGKVRWNHATPAAATVLYIDDVDADAGDLSAVWPSLTVGGFLYVQANGDSDRRNVWQKWQITSVTDATGYAKIGVSLQASNGTLVGDETIELTLQQPTPSPGIDRNVVTALSIVSGVVTIDCSLGDYFTLLLTANVTSVVFTNLPAAGMGASLAIRVQQDGVGGRTVTFPGSFKPTGGSDTAIQSGANAYTILAITSWDQGARWEYTMQEGGA